MFTGIVQGTGRIKGIEKAGRSGRITVTTSLDLSDVREGDSIAVDGVCLTVTAMERDGFRADLSEETLRITTFSHRRPGDTVNLEKALRFQDRLGGHLVTGHIDGVGMIRRRERRGDGEVMEISAPRSVMEGLVMKGSVAVDGVSLTVAGLSSSSFSVFLIPFTLRHTTLSRKRVGERVNIETDIIGKYVQRFLRREGSVWSP